MKNLTPEQKAQKKAKRQQRMIKELREEMRKDLETLHRIIYGTPKKKPGQ